MPRKKIHILGGGTFNYVRCHLALATPAFGETARALTKRIEESLSIHNLEEKCEVILTLTKMALSESNIITNDDVNTLIDEILKDKDTISIIFNIALTDFEGSIGDIKSGKQSQRLQSRDSPFTMSLSSSEKIISKIKVSRPDIILVGFKTTSGDSAQEQLDKAKRQILESNSDIVLANDISTRGNMVVMKDTTSLRVIYERKSALRLLTSTFMGKLKNVFST